MKTPIRNPLFDSKASFIIEKIIPEGSVVDSFCFYSGEIEFHLANRKRFVLAHTEKMVIKDVWDTIFYDPYPVSEIASRILPFKDDKQFSLLQEKWSSFRNPDVRAALFYFLNNCSDTGYVSKGSMNLNNYNPVSLSRLRKFVKPDNFHLSKTENIMKQITESKNDFVFMQFPKISKLFLSEGINRGIEEQEYNIESISLHTKDKPYVLLTQPSHKIKEYFECKTIFIDQYGRETTEQNAKEIILHNV